MKIADVQSISVHSPPAARRAAPVCHLVRMETDSGQVSFGEALVPAPQHLADAVELFGPVLVGMDVRDRGELGERLAGAIGAEKWPLAEYGGALSAVDLALWDLAAQAYEVPLYRLLGGAHFAALDTYLLSPEGWNTIAGGPSSARSSSRQKCRSYDGAAKLDPKQLLRWLEKHEEKAAGGVGLSLPSGAPDNLRTVQHLRKQIGPSRRLVVRLEESCPDLESAASVVEKLAKAEVFWCENILPSSAGQAYAKLRAGTELPLATGRDLYETGQFYQLVKAQSVDVVTVDLRRCGGITAGRRVADLARLAGLRVAFVGGISPLTTLAAAHLSASCPAAMPVGVPAHFVDGVGNSFTTSARLEGGFLRLSGEAGLGGELRLDNWEVYQEELDEHARGAS